MDIYVYKYGGYVIVNEDVYIDRDGEFGIIIISLINDEFSARLILKQGEYDLPIGKALVLHSDLNESGYYLGEL